MPTCPDCQGSGRYIGFTREEACTACAGSGRLVEIKALPHQPPAKTRDMGHGIAFWLQPPNVDRARAEQAWERMHDATRDLLTRVNAMDGALVSNHWPALNPPFPAAPAAQTVSAGRP